MTQGYVDVEKAVWAILGCTVCHISSEKTDQKMHEFNHFSVDFTFIGASYG